MALRFSVMPNFVRLPVPALTLYIPIAIVSLLPLSQARSRNSTRNPRLFPLPPAAARSVKPAPAPLLRMANNFPAVRLFAFEG